MHFHKVSGAGNDFIVLVEPDRDPDSEWVRRVCRRGISLGADGVFVLRRQDAGRVEMVHYNPDGGRSELCLNGTRCAVRLAAELGWGETPTIITDTAEIEGRVLDDENVELRWIWPKPAKRKLDLAIDGRAPVAVELVDVGVPYAVLDWPQGAGDADLARAPVSELGAAIRFHSQVGPRGANVAFVHAVGPGEARVRFYERGVDAETLASGTGVMATAWCNAEGDSPFTVTTVGGFRIVARFAGDGATLTGDARVLAEGRIR